MSEKCRTVFRGGCVVRPDILDACGLPPGHEGPHERVSAPHVGLFVKHADAVAEASRRAALTGYRQRVRLEPNNHWWQVTEGRRLAWWFEMRAGVGL